MTFEDTDKFTCSLESADSDMPLDSQGFQMGLTFSPEDFPASRGPLPGSEEARQMTAISGRRCFDLYGRFVRNESLARTCRALMTRNTWRSTVCFLIWKASATKGGRLKFRLVPLMPSTPELDSGLWPSPNASAERPNEGNVRMLRQKVLAGELTEREARWMLNGKSPMEAQGKIPALWATPTLNGNYNRKGASATSGDGLDTQVRMWPTPSAEDNRGRGNLSTPAVQRRARIGKQLGLSMVVSDKSGRLSPLWTEWLMGYPVGWTDFEPLETPSSPRSQPKSCER